MSRVEITTTDAVATITLNDVEKRNALGAALMGELLDAIGAAERDDDVRVVVVTNRGTTFCAGADLTDSTPAPGNDVAATLATLLGRVRHSPKPFVGRLDGHCVGGGVGLAAVMDVSVARETATFGFSEVRLGVAPAIISVVCLAKMRAGDAREMFLRGRRFSAARAVELGLISSAVAPDQLDDAVSSVVNDLLAGGPAALAATKGLLAEVPRLDEDAAYDAMTHLSASLFASPEASEGVRAFVDKRAASWVRVVTPDGPTH